MAKNTLNVTMTIDEFIEIITALKIAECHVRKDNENQADSLVALIKKLFIDRMKRNV